MSVYAVTTRPRSELIASEDLREHGIASFVPVTRKWERINGRRREVERPILPRYLFAYSADIAADFITIRHARRVTGILVTVVGTPLVICEDWISELMISQSFGLFDYTLDRKPKLTISQAVKIVAGSFAGCTGIVTRLDSKRAMVTTDGKFALPLSVLLEDLKAA